MKNLIKMLKVLSGIDEFKDSSKSLYSIVIYLLNQKAGSEDIITVASLVSCPKLISEIIIRFYEKMDANSLAKLAMKLASLSKLMDYEKIFNRKGESCSDSGFEPNIRNSILKKILDSDYFKESVNIKNAIVASKNEYFTAELLCLNRLDKKDFSEFLKSYLKFKKNSDRFAHLPSSILYVLNYCIERRDCYPAKNLSLDYFSFKEFEKIINIDYVAGSDFIKDSIEYFLKTEKESLKSMLKNELDKKITSEVNNCILTEFVKLDWLTTKQILIVAKRYNEDRWLLEDCLKSKPMQIQGKERAYVQKLVDTIIEKWRRQASYTYKYGGGIH